MSTNNVIQFPGNAGWPEYQIMVGPNDRIALPALPAEAEKRVSRMMRDSVIETATGLGLFGIVIMAVFGLKAWLS